MFFSYEIIKKAFLGLIKLDSSEGKSRKEKVSGLRYLLATSYLLKQENKTQLSLAIGSPYRQKFIDAVGSVVALGEGRYTKDFSNEFDNQSDFGVGSNFFTTRLANSRNGNIEYPGRPANGALLFLENEKISIILNDLLNKLNNAYGVNQISPELSIWLLRNYDFQTKESRPNSKALKALIESALKDNFTNEVASALTPLDSQISDFFKEFQGDIFSTTKADCTKIQPPQTLSNHLAPKILSDDLPDNDPIFAIVTQLLDRGSKGILFSGPPGTSKTWYALKIAIKISRGDEDKIERIQFHPSFTYEDFIEGLVSTGALTGTDPLFKPKDKIFLNFCNRAKLDTDNLFILIIDEFSRGDPSKIFGELLTYIESDYRNLPFRLPYSEKVTSIPQNIVIFATMNPYDKSVVDLDAAMERRFEVVELLPSVEILKSLLAQSGIQGDMLGKVIQFFTNAVKLSPHGFGHTYFKGIKEETDFILLWNHKLKFIFEKMFRFNEDAYKSVRDSYINIISDSRKNEIT